MVFHVTYASMSARQILIAHGAMKFVPVIWNSSRTFANKVPYVLSFLQTSLCSLISSNLPMFSHFFKLTLNFTRAIEIVER